MSSWPTVLLDGLQAALPDRHDDRGQGRRADVGEIEDLPPALVIRQRQPVTHRWFEDDRFGHVGVIGGDDGIDDALHHRAGGAGLAGDPDRTLAAGQVLAGDGILAAGHRPR